MKTNWKDDIFTQRKYKMQDNGDGTVTPIDKTTYTQVGDAFGAKELNEIGTEINEVKKSVSDGKAEVAAAITLKKVTTAATATFREMADNIKKIVLGSGNAQPADVLAGKTATNSSGVEFTGTMPDRGAVSSSLNCGGSYTIPAGYHNGAGKALANSLASQTPGNLAAARMLPGQHGWSDGVRVYGSMADHAGTPSAINNVRMANGRFEVAVDEGYYGCNWAGNSYEYMGFPQVASAIGLTAGKMVQGQSCLNINGTRNYIDKIGRNFNFDGHTLPSNYSEHIISIDSIPEAAAYPYILVWWGSGGGAFFPLAGAGSSTDRIYLQFNNIYYELFVRRPTLTSLQLVFTKQSGSGYGICTQANAKICAGSNTSFA